MMSKASFLLIYTFFKALDFHYSQILLASLVTMTHAIYSVGCWICTMIFSRSFSMFLYFCIITDFGENCVYQALSCATIIIIWAIALFLLLTVNYLLYSITILYVPMIVLSCSCLCTIHCISLWSSTMHECDHIMKSSGGGFILKCFGIPVYTHTIHKHTHH